LKAMLAEPGPAQNGGTRGAGAGGVWAPRSSNRSGASDGAAAALLSGFDAARRRIAA